MKTQIMTITPEMARNILNANTKNVPITKVLIEDYKSQMQKGQWKLTGQGISIANDGTLIDGQHRLLALIEANMSIDFLVITELDFDVFDNYDSGRKRTSGGVLGAHGVLNSNNMAACISRYVLLKNGYAMGLKSTNNRTIKLTNVEIKDLYFQHEELFQRISAIADSNYRAVRLLNKSYQSGLMAYLILEKKHIEPLVYTFFKELHEGKNYSNDTIRLLRDQIINSKMGNYTISPSHLLSLIAKTWNNYLTGKEVKVLKFSHDIEGSIKFL